MLSVRTNEVACDHVWSQKREERETRLQRTPAECRLDEERQPGVTHRQREGRNHLDPENSERAAFRLAQSLAQA